MQTSTGAPARGVVIGRFMPPHMGHLYLINFALSYCTDVTVLVCTLPHEPIPGDLRFEWMKQLFPAARIVHITEAIPAAQKDMPGSTAIWAKTIRTYVPDAIHFVFASEPYGEELARDLGASFVGVDPARAQFPVSATDIRNHPMRNWKHIPEPVRPYFLKRVNVLSSGNSTLARELAAEFSTLYVADYRIFLSSYRARAVGPSDLQDVVRAQRASEEALARQAKRVLFAESSALQVLAQNGRNTGTVSADTLTTLEHAVRSEHYDLYIVDGDDSESLNSYYRTQLAERGARVCTVNTGRAGSSSGISEAAHAVQELLNEDS